MDSSTTQFMYRVFIGVFAFAILLTMFFVFAVGLTQGDGEAVRIAEAFQPFLFGALAGICGLFGIHTAGQVAQAKYTQTTPPPAPSQAPQPAPQLIPGVNFPVAITQSGGTVTNANGL